MLTDIQMPSADGFSVLNAVHEVDPSLPFVSYGLTSVVCFFMGIGFVLNVGLQPNKYQ